MNADEPRRRLRIEIAPGAWPSLGVVPSASFRRLRAELEFLTEESLAELTSGASAGDEPCPLTVSFDGLTARCTFSFKDHLVTVVHVERARDAADP